jgi:hypothetical protein
MPGAAQSARRRRPAIEGATAPAADRVRQDAASSCSAWPSCAAANGFSMNATGAGMSRRPGLRHDDVGEQRRHLAGVQLEEPDCLERRLGDDDVVAEVPEQARSPVARARGWRTREVDILFTAGAPARRRPHACRRVAGRDRVLHARRRPSSHFRTCISMPFHCKENDGARESCPAQHAFVIAQMQQVLRQRELPRPVGLSAACNAVRSVFHA